MGFAATALVCMTLLSGEKACVVREIEGIKAFNAHQCLGQVESLTEKNLVAPGVTSLRVLAASCYRKGTA